MKLLINTFFVLLLLSFNPVKSQVKFSLATDISLLRNFEKDQKFTVFGQSIYPQWHLDRKNSFYAWLDYHTNGKYRTPLTATAKSPSTQPQVISFTNNSEMRLRQVSLGIKRFIIGGFDDLEGLNFYGTGGFGLVFGRLTNTFSPGIDTSLYSIQNNIASGTEKFKRLTLDVSGGFEFPISYEIYIYSEVRVNFPTSNYPDNYFFKNAKAPLFGSINIGMRVSFNADP